jgi:hypothetical protein
MRFRPVCHFLFWLAFVNAAAAQDPPRRDPQALAVLQQSLLVMGGSVPTDSLAVGALS